MILVVDNYNDFSCNIYQMIGEINSDIKVVHNDEINWTEIKEIVPDHVVISPGPGKLMSGGISIE